MHLCQHISSLNLPITWIHILIIYWCSIIIYVKINKLYGYFIYIYIYNELFLLGIIIIQIIIIIIIIIDLEYEFFFSYLVNLLEFEKKKPLKEKRKFNNMLNQEY